MRLGFIYPIYFPPLKESYLRKDFNFAKYLGYSYTQTLNKFFNIEWFTIFLLTIIISLIKLFDINLEFWLATRFTLFYPFLFLVIFYSFHLHLQKVERQLYPQINQQSNILPENLNFHKYEDSMHPFAYYDQFPIPPYLE